jgi:hypothetical protein
MLVTLLSGSVAANAQDANDRSGAPPPVRTGQTIWVTTHEHVTLSGKLLRAPDASEIRLHSRDGDRSVPMRDVARIETRDSLRNGTLIGAASGAAISGGWYALAASGACETNCGDDYARREVMEGLTWAAVGAGVGAAVGCALDALFKQRRVVYVAPIRTSTRGSVTASYRYGVTFAIRW